MCTDWKIVCICFGLPALLEDPKRTTREYNFMKQKNNNTTPEKEGGKGRDQTEKCTNGLVVPCGVPTRELC